MKSNTIHLLLLSLLPMAAFALPHVRETLTLTKGWNAVYIESTPEDASCDAFFANSAVVSAALYRSDAGTSTAQYDASGNEIQQATITYQQWVRGESASTLQTIIGGNSFLLYATNATEISFFGVPAAPKTTWRKVSSSETNEFFNLVGVLSDSSSVPVNAYFGEGPFGTSQSGRAIYSISGDDKDAGPTLKNADKGSFGRPAAISGGKAYMLTATKDGEWPGVIGVQGDSVYFGADANFASITVRNCGTKAREFRFTVGSSELTDDGQMPMGLSRRLPRVDAINAPDWTNVEESVAWTVALDPDEMTEQVFKLDRSKFDSGTEHSAILTIEDLGGSAMRVRLPVVISAAKVGAVDYPVGLWVGEIALSQVSGNDDPDALPMPAGGTLKMNVLMHVDTNGTCRLLQRVVAGVDTNGTARLFRDLENVPSEVENPKRLSTVMMSVDTPVVEASSASETSDSTFGKDIEFEWTIAPTARDNPFRHAWHPDHDGKKADYSDYLPPGDDASLYANPVKPELWSIHNRLIFSWHEQGNRATPVYFPYNADETTAGYVVWDVAGLVANKSGMIRSVGTFYLKRAFKAAELEE